MALLTADDILNKKFAPTKFREGYDQDEVDDFLDEVVTTLRAVQTENDELKDKLAAAERRVAELTRAGAAAGPSEVDDASSDESGDAVEAPGTTTSGVGLSKPAGPTDASSAGSTGASTGASGEASAAVAVPAGAAASAGAAQAAPGAAPSRASEPESATGMLLLAQKLHDDYVRSGKEESERLLSEAREQGSRIVREAEETSHRTLSQLEQERSLLERKIDELRVFERDYRTRLKSYLENLLGDLDNRGSALPPRAGQAAEGASGTL